MALQPRYIHKFSVLFPFAAAFFVIVMACSNSGKKKVTTNPSPLPAEEGSSSVEGDNQASDPPATQGPAPSSPSTPRTPGANNGGQGCASFCINVPQNVFGFVPQCARCNANSFAAAGRNPGTPIGGQGCASFCSSVPRIAQPFVPQCQSC